MSLFKRKHIKQILLILIKFILLLFIIMMIQDFLISKIFNKSYYFYESLLFKTPIILLIIPAIIYSFFVNIRSFKTINVSQVLAYLIPISIAHVLVASLVISIISQSFMDSTYSFWYLIQNKFTNDLLFLVTIYGLMYLIVRYYSFKHQDTFRSTLTVKNGSHAEIIPIEDIEWITAETPYVGVWVQNRKHLYQATLKSILNTLNPDQFIRIHRSTIINISKINKISSRKNGDYDILLVGGKSLRLSRNYRNNLKSSQLKF